MSTKQKEVDLAVIDDKLLGEAILDEVSAAEAEGIRAAGDPNLVELSPACSTLVLSFKNIGRIENLIGFDNLLKLYLDNNQIEEIGNIGHLTKLQWLDLSFNKIREIKGLENLTDLKDVSFYSNKIRTIKGLENCKKIECLSLGNNKIESLDQIIKLRSMECLKSLSIAGNKVCEDNECRNITLVYLDKLQYLDYALIEEHERHLAMEQYHDELLDVKEKEGVLMEQLSREKGEVEYKAFLTKAGCLFAYVIFDEIMSGDTDLEKLKHLPGIKDLIEAFRTQFKEVSEEYLKKALDKNSIRDKEIGDFENTVKSLRGKDDAESTSLIDAFNRSNKEVVLKLTSEGAKELYSPQDVAVHVDDLCAELERVCDELMSQEIRQTEKFESVVDEFDNRLNDFKNENMETQQSFFRSVEAMEDEFSRGMGALVSDLIDRLAREELAEDFLDDEAITLLMDKDSCMGVVNLSHDVHIGRILKAEDQARGIEMSRYTSTVQGHMDGERNRNRNRVLEIHEWARSCKINIQGLLVVDEEEGVEDQ